MKPPLRFAPLISDKRARVPAMLCCVLVAALAVQLAVPRAPATPEGGEPLAPHGRTDAAGPRIVPTSGGPAIVARSPFAPPTQTTTTGAGATPAGIALIGAVRIGTRTFAVVRAADGRILQLPIGGATGGDRLRAVTPAGAIFVRDGRSSFVPFGGDASSALEPSR